MKFKITDLSQGNAILAGVAKGKKLFAALVELAPVFDQPHPVFLDFSGVQICTASFLRESLIAFRDYCRKSASNGYPVIANASSEVLEEFEFFLNHRDDAFWSCHVDKAGSVTEAKVIGSLDGIQRETLKLIEALGSAAATELAGHKANSEKIGATAWNNRLAGLSNKGLIIESKSGKTKSFSLLLRRK